MRDNMIIEKECYR